MSVVKITKKILSILLCASIFLMPLFSVSLPACSQEIQNITYDFSDEAQAEFDAHRFKTVQPSDSALTPQTQKTKSKKVKKSSVSKEDAKPKNDNISIPNSLEPSLLRGAIVYVPEGTSFQAVLQSTISSESLVKNDIIAAVLYEDWIYNGVLLAPQGSILYGKAIETKKSGSAYANGSLSITFHEILTPKGEKITLVSNIVTVSVENKRPLKIAANILGGAVMGVAAGALYTLLSGGDVVTGIAVGGGIGAAGGTVNAIAHKGEEVEIPSGTGINIRLIKPMNAAPYG